MPAGREPLGRVEPAKQRPVVQFGAVVEVGRVGDEFEPRPGDRFVERVGTSGTRGHGPDPGGQPFVRLVARMALGQSPGDPYVVLVPEVGSGDLAGLEGCGNVILESHTKQDNTKWD